MCLFYIIYSIAREICTWICCILYCYIISTGPSTSETPLRYPIHIKTYIANHKYDSLDIMLQIMFDIHRMGTTHSRKMLILPSPPLKANIIKTERPWHMVYVFYYLTYCHYRDVIMRVMASQIFSLKIVYLTICSDTNQRKHQGSASLAWWQTWHFRIQLCLSLPRTCTGKWLSISFYGIPKRV